MNDESKLQAIHAILDESGLSDKEIVKRIREVLYGYEDEGEDNKNDD